MSIPAILFWVLAAAALFAPEGFAMALFICSAPFGALNTLPEGVGGGVNLLPQSVAVLVFAARIFSRGVSPELVLKPLMNWRGFALFAAFVAYAIFTAMVLPHMFEGRVDVIPMDDPVRQPLHPSGANFNQSAYLVVDLIAAMTLFVYLRRGEGEAREKLFGALLVSGALYVATGLIEYSGALPQVVASFRNASYNLFSNTEIAGVRRITGFFPEASAYGPRCVVMGALLFFGRFALRGGQLRNWWAPALSLALIAMGALSTSSTAFVAIFVFAALVIIRTALQLRRRVGLSGVRLELGLMAFLAFVLVAAWTLNPNLLLTPIELLNALIFKKAETGSFYERSMWNHVGKLDFFATDGLGVGAGSTRTSNWAISLLSNTGALGFALMMGYLVVIFTRAESRLSERTAVMVRGAKYALLVLLAAELVTGGNIDPGLNLAILTVMVAAGSRWAEQFGASRRSGGARPRRRAPAPTGAAVRTA